MTLKRTEWVILAFTCAYILGFLAYFILISNREFIGYILTMAVLIGVVAWAHRLAQFPASILWALSVWGLAHMAGGGIRAGDGVLYNLVILPLVGTSELTILKFDQVVHFYGFAVTAWLLWHLLRALYPMLRHSRAIYIFAALGSMGLGAANEVIEFAAVMLIPNTNVGGYYNTALDLVFNGLGAAMAVVTCAIVEAARK
jgi:Predicted membrane protein (DUF2238)